MLINVYLKYFNLQCVFLLFKRKTGSDMNEIGSWKTRSDYGIYLKISESSLSYFSRLHSQILLTKLTQLHLAAVIFLRSGRDFFFHKKAFLVCGGVCFFGGDFGVNLCKLFYMGNFDKIIPREGKFRKCNFQ